MPERNSSIFLGLAAILLSGCAVPMAYYNQAERGGIVILPDNYEVNSINYPQYGIKHSRLSPSDNPAQRQVWMFTTDSWIVTHKIGRNYLIFSHAYEQRLCRKLKEWMRKEIKKNESCEDDNPKIHVLIDPNGDVIGDGWVGVYDAKRVWKPDRMVDLPIGKSATPIWGPQPSFKKINTSLR